jgi:peptidoglycan/LPS O-acetylase OafA/YrhL
MAYAFSPTIGIPGFGDKTDLSYGIYLYAFPIQQVIVALYLRGQNGAPPTPARLFAIALPLSIAAAWLSWTFVEKRFLVRAGSSPKVTPVFETGAALQPAAETA